MCICLIVNTYFELKLEVQIWQFPLSKRGQGGLFQARTRQNFSTMICVPQTTFSLVYFSSSCGDPPRRTGTDRGI